MCGANGDSNATSGSRIARLRQSPNSLRQIMKAATDVLKEKFSMSSRTFRIVLCSVLSSLSVGASSVTARASPSKKSRQNRFRNLCTPSMPFVSQGFDCSNGPRNISYMRSVSAPYCSMT